MSGIMPNLSSGGVAVRDELGDCLNPANVQFFYCPSPSFTSSCAITYLPEGCDARITAAQINALQAEILCFAEALNPQGNWNCGQVCNISGLFQQWLQGSYEGSLLSQIEQKLCESPLVLDPFENVPFASIIHCDGDGNIFRGPVTDTVTQEELEEAVLNAVEQTIIYVSDDETSVTLIVAQAIIIDEEEEPYPSVTLEIEI